MDVKELLEFCEAIKDNVLDAEWLKEHARLGIRPKTDDGVLTQDYLDLELYVYIYLGDHVGAHHTFSIHQEHMEILGIEWHELLQIAAENMDFVATPVTELIKQILIEEGCPPSLAKMLVPQLDGDDSMFVITSSPEYYGCSRLRGASALALGNQLYEFAESINADLFIFPSSIHEIIAVPADFGQDPEDMRKMVEEINCTEVDPGEKLSDNVYYFCRETGEVTIL